MLDKKSLRQYADPGLTIPQGHGLLHAPQVSYIVRTAVQIISHRRTLVLYVYDRKQAAAGNFTPVWTMFHAGGEYITLAVEPDGKARWRTARFVKLDNDYFFTSKCAFYSSQDEQRVCSFFHDRDHGGIAALTHAQQTILDRRLQKRLCQREQKVMVRMSGLPTLPRDLGDWLRRDILPAYFLYSHARHGKATGVCSACGDEFVLTDVKHNGTASCPHCGRELTMKAKGRMGKLFDRLTCQVIQRTKAGELVIRIIKVNAPIQNDEPQIAVWENARQFVRVDPEGRILCDCYYETWDGNWKQGERPVFYPYSYNFYADTCGYLYRKNLPDVLLGTSWQYCPLADYSDHFQRPMEVYPFLSAHLRHPRLEHLVKTGFFRLASDLVYRIEYSSGLDETQNRTHRILNVAVEDVAFLRELDVGMENLQRMQVYYRNGVKDRQKLLTWQIDRKINMDLSSILAHTTPHKLIRYADGQYGLLRGREGKYGGLHYDSIKTVVREYIDYLEMCVKLGYDLRNNFVLFPKDLQKSHDRTAQRMKIKIDMKMRENFQKAYKRIKGQLDFELDGMKIVYPASLDEIITEGHALHHCVGGYVSKVAARKTMILFLRRCEAADKPFYTVEVLNGEVAQVRGIGNCDATPEVNAFMSRWKRQVLHAAPAA